MAGLDVGQKVTYFELPDQLDYPWSLSGQLELGPVMLVFYRGDWDPYCNGQLASYARQFEEFERTGGPARRHQRRPPVQQREDGRETPASLPPAQRPRRRARPPIRPVGRRRWRGVAFRRRHRPVGGGPLPLQGQRLRGQAHRRRGLRQPARARKQDRTPHGRTRAPGRRCPGKGE